MQSTLQAAACIMCAPICQPLFGRPPSDALHHADDKSAKHVGLQPAASVVQSVVNALQRCSVQPNVAILAIPSRVYAASAK
jgi:hypothetical protein